MGDFSKDFNNDFNGNSAMTKEQLKALVDANIAGQGNQVDAAGILPAVLNELIDKAFCTGASFLSLERLRKYLYRITFDTVPQPNGYVLPAIAGCSAYVQNGKLYRNLDFYYDNAASFIVRTREFEGVAFMTGLNDGELIEDKINQLPYRMVDGRNNNGIMASVHILFNDWEYTGAGTKSIPLTQLPYKVLTLVKSMATIQQDLAEVLGNLNTENMGEYLIQMLITDGTTTYALVPPTTAEASYELVDATQYPKMTNFRYVARAEVSRYDMDLQDRPTGIERFNAMPCSLEDLRFTKCYESADWLSEFIGIDHTTKASSDEELIAIYNKAHALYESRTRDGKTWQTMHSVIYGKKMESLHIQEDWADEIIAFAPDTPETVLMIQSERNTTVGGYQVPELTAEQVQQAYNAVVTGRGCIIIDHNETMHAYVNQADQLNDELSIGILFYSSLILTYTLSDSAVTITHVEI